MAAEAQHAHVHLAAAADDRHVGRNLAVDERAALLDERKLIGDAQMVRKPEGAWRDLHGRTLPLPVVERPSGLIAALLLLLARPVLAHPAPFSYIDLRLQPAAIEGTVVAHIFDLGHDLNIDPAERLLDPAVAAQQSAAIARPVDRTAAPSRPNGAGADAGVVRCRGDSGSAVGAARGSVRAVRSAPAR